MYLDQPTSVEVFTPQETSFLAYLIFIPQLVTCPMGMWKSLLRQETHLQIRKALDLVGYNDQVGKLRKFAQIFTWVICIF